MKEHHDYPSSYYSPRRKRRKHRSTPISSSTSTPTAQASSRAPAFTDWLLPTAAVLLLAAAAAGAKAALAWPLAHDSPLMHYAVFLISHGQAPYREIVDTNLPGTYLLDGAVIHLIGGGPFAWWFYDCLLNLTAILACTWLAGPRRRAAGIAAGALATMIHLTDGVPNLGHPDWAVAVFLLLALACLFQTLRSHHPAWMAGFAAFATFAATIDPPMIVLAILFLPTTLWLANRPQASEEFPKRISPPSLVLWSLLGAAIPTAAVALFLLHYGVTASFLATLHGLIPWYASLQHQPVGHLLELCAVLNPILFGTIPLFLLTRNWRRWESTLLAAAALSEVALFFAQATGSSSHLYPFIAFAALWGMLEIDSALHFELPSQPASKRSFRPLATRTIAVLTLLTTVLVFSHRLRSTEHAAPYPMDTITDLESDLTSLGGQQLSNNIQCLDMTMGGCINTLYRLRLVQSTGFLQDFYLFPEHPNAVTDALQTKFLNQINFAPPKVIVLSAHTWPSTTLHDNSGDTYSYDQLTRWPAFDQLLAQRYTLAREIPNPPYSAGYRIYTLNSASPPPPAHPAATLDHSPQVTALELPGSKASAPPPMHTAPTASPVPTASRPSS
jgi:hypothetical protein